VTDERDKGTADDWVHRLSSMIRLTGRHPFNAEPNTKELVDAGFITPVAMHYVRYVGRGVVCAKGLGLQGGDRCAR